MDSVESANDGARLNREGKMRKMILLIVVLAVTFAASSTAAEHKRGAKSADSSAIDGGNCPGSQFGCERRCQNSFAGCSFHAGPVACNSALDLCLEICTDYNCY